LHIPHRDGDGVVVAGKSPRTITGSNDAPVITAPELTGSATEAKIVGDRRGRVGGKLALTASALPSRRSAMWRPELPDCTLSDSVAAVLATIQAGVDAAPRSRWCGPISPMRT
jgi:hypothetical protein